MASTVRLGGASAPKAVPASRSASGPAHVERNRLRTWEPDDTGDAQPWRIIARYSLVRVTRTWWLMTLLVIIGVATITSLGVFTYELGRGHGVDSDGAFGLLGFAGPAAVLLLVVGAPLFAEDLRFNAPLFYFSRPVVRDQYLVGKAAFLAFLVGAVAIVPIALMLLATLVAAPFAQPPDYIAGDAMRTESWRLDTIDTFADALYVLVTLLPGAAVVVAFLTSATLLASACTRRGWHAALAVVTGMLGVMATEFTRNAWQNIFGPFGWMYLVTSMPLELRFTRPHEEALARQGGYSYLTQAYDGAGPAIVVAYVLLIGATLLMAYETRRRILAQGVDS